MLSQLIKESETISLSEFEKLRIKLGVPAYGKELSEDYNPIEAGLQRFLSTDSATFCGSDSINSSSQKENAKRLIAFQTQGRGPIPRQHSLITNSENIIGEVTSGGYSPSLDTNIGLGYVRYSDTQVGQKVYVIVRDHSIEVEIVDLPFYKRQR